MRSAAEIAELVGTHPPTPEQQAVIEAPLEPALVVAGAGSGKTETMAARVVYLVANGLVEPDRVLGLTFTRKAAGELSDRVRARLRALRRATGGQGTGFHAPTVA
uniref:UvrD-helicase domain-containing protein n=1 Tax=Actinotalea sp. TaxID=1872145 RepID=UPI0035626CF3